MKRKTGLGSMVFDTFNVLVMLVLIIVMLYPMVYVFSASISDDAMVSSGQVLLLPKGLTLHAYKTILNNPDVWISYWNTVRYTAVHTLFTLIVTAAMAYPLAKKWLPGRRTSDGCGSNVSTTDGNPRLCATSTVRRISSWWPRCTPAAWARASASCRRR